MPTPDDEIVTLPQLQPTSALSQGLHATCPPEDDRPPPQDPTSPTTPATPNADASLLLQQIVTSGPASPSRLPSSDNHALSSPRPLYNDQRPTQRHIRTVSSPVTTGETARTEVKRANAVHGPPNTAPSLPPNLQGPDNVTSRVWLPFAQTAGPTLTRLKQRTPPHTMSFLRQGTKFTGTQQSDRQVYNVQVEIKHVDMAESFICGYLRIEGASAALSPNNES